MIRLFINGYADPDPARDAELRRCLAQNEDFFGAKAIVHVLGRPPVSSILSTIAAHCPPGDDSINILANADIVFDETICWADARCAKSRLGPGDCWALTRWEPTGIFCDDNGKPRVDSQDAWVFRGPIKPALLPGRKWEPAFSLGVRGCDNSLAYLLRMAGYRVLNPSLDVRAWHVHASAVRRYGHAPGDAVPKPYLLIPPHKRGESPHHDVRS